MAKNQSTYISYKKLEKASKELNNLKTTLENLKINLPKNTMENVSNIQIPTAQDVTDYWKNLDIFDLTFAGYINDLDAKKDLKLHWGKFTYPTYNTKEIIDGYTEILNDGNVIGYSLSGLSDTLNSGLAKVGFDPILNKALGTKLKFNIPSMEKIVEDTYTEPTNKLIAGFENTRDNLVEFCKTIKTYNGYVDDLIKSIDIESKNITSIYDAYKDLENSAKKKFKGSKGKNYNKKVIATKYEALVSIAGVANAKKYLKKILKDNTKCKISSSKVISIYNEYKKKGKISGNVKSITKDKNKDKGKDKGSGTPIITLSSTGAAVVSTKSKKKSTKKTKTNKKNNKKGKNTAVASAATIVSYERTMKEKSTTIDNIKKGTANKIEQSRLNYTKNVSQINSDRDAKIANIEADRDNKISDLYSDASDKINKIDANDSNATEQINTIKKELEDNINNTNEEANAAIAKAKEEAVQKIADAKSDYEHEVSSINKASSDEIENITENGLASETNTGKDFAKAANDQPTAVEVDDSALQSANDNKTDATSSLSDNQSNYANDLSQKEQEITNISNTPPAADNNESEAAAPSVDNSTQQNNSQPSNNTSENVVTNSSNSNETYTQSSSEPDYSNYNDNTVETSDSGVEESDVVETPAVPDDTEEETMIPSNPNDEVEESDVDSTASEIIEPTKTKKGPNVAIPIGLGVAAAGAATVAGIRYAKNRKQNEDVDETYDDEDNNVDDYESGSDDSEYMKDDYLGPAGSMYTETDLPEDSEQSDIPDDTIYNNTDHLEEELDDDDDTFPDDEVLNSLG